MNNKNFSIRRKTVVMFSVILLIFIMGLYYSTYITIFQNIDQIERELAGKTAKRFFYALKKEKLQLYTLARDYAVWDQSYDFINSKDTAYITENIAEDVMRNLQLDYLLFQNNNSVKIYAKNRSFKSQDELFLADSIKNMITSKVTNSNKDSYSGIVKIHNLKFPVIITSHKIFKNNRQGESNGVLTFVRILDNNLLEHFANDIQEKLTFIANPKIFEEQFKDSVMIESNSDYYAVNLLVRDCNSDIAAEVSLNIDSIVNSESKRNSLLVVLFFLAGGIILIIVFSLYIRMILLQKLEQASSTIKEIGDKQDFSIRLTETVDDEYYELSRTFNTMLNRLENAEKESAEQMSVLQDILNNSDQGFLLFGADGIVLPQYSQQCVKLFKAYPENQPFAQLLQPDDHEQQEFLKNILFKILTLEDQSKIEIYLSLLPSEVNLYDRNISLKYKLLTSGKNPAPLMMVIMTDHSNQKLIESAMEKEQSILKMIVKVVVDYNDFMSLINEYRHFVLFRIFEMLRDEKVPTEKKATEIIRQIHTFKGNFGQFDMFGIYNRLNNLESEYFAQLDHLKYSEPFVLLNFISRFNMLEWLDEEMRILKKTLGEAYFMQGHRYWITREKLDEIENKILSYLPVYKYRTVLPELKRIMFNPFKEMFHYHLNYISYLSTSQNKPLKPVTITGGEFLVDTILYNPLIKSLVHVFRNSIDHGIESQEERLTAGKDEYGEIKILLTKSEDHVEIHISDDGRGIRLDKVLQKAIALNIVSPDIGSHLPQEEIVNFIFRPEFSTTDTVSDLSGRGMGLSAVKKEIEKISGTISVVTVEGQGTEFILKLPMEIDYTKVYKVTIFDFMNHLTKEVKKIMIQDLKIDVDTQNDINLHRAGQLIINRFSAVISVYGIVKGSFTISADDKLAHQITAYFLGADNELAQKDKYVESSIAEFANVVIGNTIKEFSDFEKTINFSPPYTILSEKTVIKYLDSQVWNCDIATESGLLNINMVIPNKA